MIRRRLAFALAVAFAMAPLRVPVAQAASAEIDAIMRALAQRRHGHVSFVEEKFIALLDKPVRSSGELLYDAPDRLEKRTLTPKPESLVLQQGVVTADRGRRHYVLDLRQYPQIVPFIESVRATLAGDRAALERVFRLELEGTRDAWTLNLLPLDAKLSRTVRLIRIEGAYATVHRVEIFEADGDRSVLTIGAEIPP